MNKKETALIDKFKKLEEELLEVLKLEDIAFDEETKKQTVKTQLKSYIKKVEKARKLFEEYEKTAKEIEGLAVSDVDELNAKVVELREDVLDESVKEVFIDEILSQNGETKVVKKKVKKTPSSKEF